MTAEVRPFEAKLFNKVSVFFFRLNVELRPPTVPKDPQLHPIHSVQPTQQT